MNEGVRRLGEGDREKGKSFQRAVPGHQPDPWQKAMAGAKN